MCAACPTPHLNQSYELRPPWEQHLRYVPHRVRNGYNRSVQSTYVFRHEQELVNKVFMLYVFQVGLLNKLLLLW